MSAVEYLEEKLLELFGDHLPFELLDEAKEMEKQQIIDAYDAGLFDGTIDDVNDRMYKQYYNETFNK